MKKTRRQLMLNKQRIQSFPKGSIYDVYKRMEGNDGGYTWVGNPQKKKSFVKTVEVIIVTKEPVDHWSQLPNSMARDLENAWNNVKDQVHFPTPIASNLSYQVHSESEQFKKLEVTQYPTIFFLDYERQMVFYKLEGIYIDQWEIEKAIKNMALLLEGDGDFPVDHNNVPFMPILDGKHGGIPGDLVSMVFTFATGLCAYKAVTAEDNFSRAIYGFGGLYSWKQMRKYASK